MENNHRSRRPAVTPHRRSFLPEQRPAAPQVQGMQHSIPPVSAAPQPQPVAKTINLTISTASIKRLVRKTTSVVRRQVKRFVRVAARQKFWRPVGQLGRCLAAWGIWQRIANWALWDRIADTYDRVMPAKQRRLIARTVANNWVRAGLVVVVLVLLLGDVFPAFQSKLQSNVYAMGSAESLLGESNDTVAQKLKFDAKQNTYEFNANYSPQSEPNALSSSGSTPQITASLGQDAKKGITVNDPTSQLGLTMTPKFNVWPGKQNTSRVVYPLYGGDGWLVYSLHNIGVKEDVLLKRAPGETANYTYDLNLGDSYAAKLLPNGSVGVYGNTTLSGNVATGSAKDAALLDKARKHAPKNTLLFVIPAPSITGPGKTVSTAKAKYSLDGSILTVHATGLAKASYPLTIDPSIYVETAEKFMNGNNETNIDFDVADTLIQKGKTTGARFNQWNATTNLNSTLWQQGIAVAGGYMYQVGGQAFNGHVYSTIGTDTYTVPAGVTTITVKAWGGGGGGGAGSGSSGAGGTGGGAGFVQTDLTVTPGQVLTIVVGSGGIAAATNTDGGAGGGYSAVKTSTGTFLAQAGGGGGGGGVQGGTSAGVGGAGGGTSGVAGTAGTAVFLSGTAGGGGGAGTTSAGGSAGSAGSAGTAGAAGAANAGGDGGGSGGTCNTSVSGSTGGSGGTGAGGAGGTAANCVGGGGGGGGRFGGGGGGSASTGGTRGAGGGGGGSSLATGANITQTAGSGTTPGQSSDSFRNGAGTGGTGGTTAAGATAGSGGLVAVVVTGSASVNTASVNWAKFSTSDGSITSANPGTGTCSGWCTSSAYDLPAPRTNLAMLAYNGFLYAVGGEDSSCTTANGTGDSGVCKTVYIAKLGANGEPRLWHPTSTTQSSWVYWYRASDLSTPRSYAGLVAYNNRMYLMGGKTSSSGVTSAVSTVEEADVTGNGLPTSWTTSGMVTLRDPANNANALARWGFGTQVYNGHIYVIGGASTLTGAPSANSQYITLAADGTMTGNWIKTSSLDTGVMTYGGNFVTVWGAYIYVVGGCTTLNASGYCTNISNSIQLASINTDGSLDVWDTNSFVGTAPAPDARMGYSLVAWRGYIYEVGGCSNQDTSTGLCTNTLNTINYGTINQDGDASTVNQSSASGTAPCSGTTPYSCNLPSSVGNVLDVAAVMNGYLYIMGGCSNNACSTVSTGITYQAIASDGSLQKPATCTGSYTTSYCVSSTSLPSGVAAAGTAVFGGRIYMVGGFNTGTNIYYATINTDGSIASVTQNTNNLNNLTSGDTTKVTALTYAYAYARANPSSAGTNPGNLYIFGGCMDQSVGCSTYSSAVYKCNISTDGSIAPTSCTDSGQLQIGTVPAQLQGSPPVLTNPTGPGLGAMAGAVYANYIYLIGGLAPGITDMKTVRYAKFDNNNNVVAVSGSSWTEGPNQTATGRRRGAGFGYNGYLYVVGGYDGTGSGTVLDDIEFAKINVSNGSWGGFTNSSVTINQRWGLTVPVSNSYAYVIGGCTVGDPPGNCTTRTSTTQTFQIYNNDSGAPGGFTAIGSNNQDRIGASSAILNGYIYNVGGCTVIACTSLTGSTYYATVDANGSVGSWTSGNVLPSSALRAWGKLLTAGGSLYYVGGQSGAASTTAQSTVYYANTFSSGNPTWSTVTTGTLPAARTQFGAAVWNNRLYVVGGYDATGAVNNTVYVSPQLSSGGNITSAWDSSSSTGFNIPRAGLSVVAYANNLYVLGGFDGTNYLNDVQYAQIVSSGASAGLVTGSWTYSTSLPTALRDAEAFAVNGYIYVVGGRSAATTCRPIMLVSPISANTTIATGNNPTGVGEWYETNAKYTGDRYGAATAYANGKLFVTGGGCSAMVQNTGPDLRMYSTALLSQPQVAQYSIMFDTDDDVYPQKWLLNGLDNSVGAYWQLNYKSMSTTTNCAASAMTTFGQNTTVNPVTLGTPGTYTVYDGSGTNIRCGRYFYLLVTIDSSQAYGYPEDVSRGPTITDLTFEFQARAGNRLMHGQSFNGGLHQPDDTPF